MAGLIAMAMVLFLLGYIEGYTGMAIAKRLKKMIIKIRNWTVSKIRGE